MWENINCGDFINCGRLSSLLWVVLNAISLYYVIALINGIPEKFFEGVKWLISQTDYNGPKQQ